MLSITSLLLVFAFRWNFSHGGDCDYYLATSHNPNMGRAVIAGRSFHADSATSDFPGIVVSTDSIQDTQLINYVYQVYDYESETNIRGYSKLLFGAAMLMNHHSNATKALDHYSANEDAALVENVDEAQTSFGSDSFIFPEAVEAGDEIFSYYGVKWFEQRDLSILEPESEKRYSKDYLDEFGYCLSDIYVAPSSLPLGGSGLFAGRSFRKGEVVSVSPALLMRTDSPVMESVVANYVYASPGCDYALLPIALPAMLNHQPEDVANIEVRWMSHKTPNVSTKTSGVHSETSPPADEQSNVGKAPLAGEAVFPVWTQHAPEDILSSLSAQVDLEYVALNDIAMGEELSLFYGRSWEATWSIFLATRLEMEREYAEEGWSRQEACNAAESSPTGAAGERAVGCLAAARSRLSGGDKRYQGNAFMGTAFSNLHANMTDQEMAAEGKFRHPIEAPKGLFPASWFGLTRRLQEAEEEEEEEDGEATTAS